MPIGRKQQYIDREIQTSLARRVLLHWVVFLLASVLGIILWTRLVEAPLESWANVLTMSLGHLAPVLIVAFALLPLFVWDAIGLSNRFAGPIIRVRRTLSDLADGKSPQLVEFRSGDFWQTLASDLNRVLLSTRSKSE